LRGERRRKKEKGEGGRGERETEKARELFESFDFIAKFVDNLLKKYRFIWLSEQFVKPINNHDR
jgi:hypothetical protein